MSSSEAPSIVITCLCGAKVRVPAQMSGRSFRCPKCKADFATTASAQVIASYRIKSNQTPSTCPICQTAIQPGEDAIDCPSCGQVHHRECWVEVGGCSTYGCQQAPATEKETAEQPLSAWGDTKSCPVCGESIKSIAVVCRYCKTRFDSVDPITLRDMHKRSRNLEGQKNLRQWAVALFVITVIVGFLAPVMAAVNVAWVLTKRTQLAAAGPVYLILGYSAIGVSVLYSILMLLFFLFGRS